MLRLGTTKVVKDKSIRREKVIPIQIDFSTRENILQVSTLLKEMVQDSPILYSLLGNTLSNFEDDKRLLENLKGFLRPQDLLLLEVATTDIISDKAAKSYRKL